MELPVATGTGRALSETGSENPGAQMLLLLFNGSGFAKNGQYNPVRRDNLYDNWK